MHGDMSRMVDADVITIALLKERLDEWDLRLEKLEGRIDRLLDDHETRLRRLEAWSYGIPVAALISLGSVIAALIATFK